MRRLLLLCTSLFSPRPSGGCLRGGEHRRTGEAPTGHDGTLTTIFLVALGIPLVLTVLTLIDIARGKHTQRHADHWRSARTARGAAADRVDLKRRRASRRSARSRRLDRPPDRRRAGPDRVPQPDRRWTDPRLGGRCPDGDRLRALRRSGAGPSRAVDEPTVRAHRPRRVAVCPRDLGRQGKLLCAGAGGARPGRGGHPAA